MYRKWEERERDLEGVRCEQVGGGGELGMERGRAEL